MFLFKKILGSFFFPFIYLFRNSLFGFLSSLVYTQAKNGENCRFHRRYFSYGNKL